jgi:hypothetical protein
MLDGPNLGNREAVQPSGPQQSWGRGSGPAADDTTGPVKPASFHGRARIGTSRSLGLQEPCDRTGDRLGVVHQGPVAAMRKDDDLGSGEELMLRVGKSHGNYGSPAPQMTSVGGAAPRKAAADATVAAPRSGVAR